MRPVRAPSPGRLRRAGRAGLALAFAALLVTAAAVNAFGEGHRGGHRFSHSYPPNPVPLERPKVAGAAPVAPRANRVKDIRLRSLAQLAEVLPRGVLVRRHHHWRLTEPVAITKGALLENDGGRLDLGPHAFLAVQRSGRIVLRHTAVTAVGPNGHPLSRPTNARGFIVARDGGSLVLEHDTFTDLGHLGIVSYGISFRRSGRGSRILDCRISGNYFGVFLSHAEGVRVAGNRIVRSLVYGIDPYGLSSHDVIEDNVVAQSGLHAIVLANGVRQIVVRRNLIVAPRVHGIVLVNHVSDNRIEDNRIESPFDGIVVTASSGNTIARNRIVAAQRFGIRLSRAARANRVVSNALWQSLLGIYVYDRASANSLLRNSFRDDVENIRVRSDAPRNVVAPVPRLSEVP